MKGLILLIVSATFTTSLSAQYVPSWWHDAASPVLVGTISASSAPANLGQLKWIATRAAAHLNATLPGGAGTNVNTMVAGFTPQIGVTYTPTQLAQFHANNFAPINLGQLKIVALPFYDRLWALSPRYDTNLNLKANGYPQSWTGQYPWDPATPKSANYAPVTIGQLKLVFSFDIVDANGNGTLDYLEGIYPAANPARDTDGDGVPDAQDAYPNDPTRAVVLPPFDSSDHTAPTITLTKPTGATLTP